MIRSQASARFTELFGTPLPFNVSNTTAWSVPTAPGRRCRIVVNTALPDVAAAWVDTGGAIPAYQCILESPQDIEKLAAKARALAASGAAGTD